MIEIYAIGAVITLLLGIVIYAYNKGKNDEKNKSFKRAVTVVKKNQELRKDIAKRNRTDKLEQL